MANNASNQENSHNDLWYPDILDTTGNLEPFHTDEAIRKAFALIYSLRKKLGTSGGTGPAGPPGANGTNGANAIPLLLPNKTFQGQAPLYNTPLNSATPSATNTVTMTVTFASPHGWVTGTRVTVSASGGGLTAGTTYYLGIPSSTTAQFYLTVAAAQAGSSPVALSSSITAVVTPNAVVVATVPATAYATSMFTMQNEGTASNWLVSFTGTAPTTTSYSVKLQPGSSTLGLLGDAYTQENPPTNDICVLNDGPAATGAGIMSWFLCYNDGTSPLAGPTGPQGTAGSTWYEGAGAPAGGLGVNGDFYLNVSGSITGLPGSQSVNDFRLTTQSGTPVTTSDVIGAGTIFLTPTKGTMIALYSGSIWQCIVSSEVSLALSALTSGKNYDVFAWNNSGTVTLELSAAWSSDTARTDAIVQQDGVWVKSADHKRRYIGTIRTTGTTTTEDSRAKRFVWNAYNQVQRPLSVKSAVSTWTYASVTWRQADALASNQLDLVVGLPGVMIGAQVTGSAQCANNSTEAFVGIGEDSTSALHTDCLLTASTGYGTNSGDGAVSASLRTYINGVGRHFYAWLESCGNTNTVTFFGGSGPPQSGINGEYMG